MILYLVIFLSQVAAMNQNLIMTFLYLQNLPSRSYPITFSLFLSATCSLDSLKSSNSSNFWTTQSGQSIATVFQLGSTTTAFFRRSFIICFLRRPLCSPFGSSTRLTIIEHVIPEFVIVSGNNRQCPFLK